MIPLGVSINDVLQDADDEYTLTKRLGSGAQGTVYLAKLKNRDRNIVLKLFLVDDVDELNKITKTEVRPLMKLRHKHIIGCEGSFVHDEILCIILDYYKDGDLDAYIKTLNGSPSEIELLHFTSQMIDALLELEKNKIIHRDVKPHNIFMDHKEDGIHFVLGDFGLAKTLANKSRASSIVGSNNYIAPEVLLQKPYTNSADIFSLGCTLLHYALKITKTHAFFILSEETRREHLDEMKRELTNIYSSSFTNLIISMIQLNPEDRPILLDIKSQIVDLQKPPPVLKPLSSNTLYNHQYRRKLTFKGSFGKTPLYVPSSLPPISICVGQPSKKHLEQWPILKQNNNKFAARVRDLRSAIRWLEDNRPSSRVAILIVSPIHEKSVSLPVTHRHGIDIIGMPIDMAPQISILLSSIRISMPFSAYNIRFNSWKSSLEYMKVHTAKIHLQNCSLSGAVLLRHCQELSTFNHVTFRNMDGEHHLGKFVLTLQHSCLSCQQVHFSNIRNLSGICCSDRSELSLLKSSISNMDGHGISSRVGSTVQLLNTTCAHNRLHNVKLDDTSILKYSKGCKLQSSSQWSPIKSESDQNVIIE